MEKILIVEDEKILRDALTIKLKDEGFEILEAEDGLAGLDMALAEKPDLILLDIIMPVMDGITMLQKLRDDPEGKKIKVIILTNLQDQEKVTEAVKNNTQEYLIKSDWSLSDIVLKIKEKLSME